MTDGVTSFVKAPFVSGVSVTQKLSPSVLDLGSYNLTRNPRTEAALRLFARASSGAAFSGLNSFVAVAAAQNLQSPQGANSKAPPPGPNTAAGQAYAAALDLLQQRGTPADAYLQQLLSQSQIASLGNAPQASAPASTLKLNVDSGATVQQGGTTAITAATLAASAGTTPNTNIVYSLTGLPSSGHLEYSYAPGKAITSFTQADLAAGLVQYVNNGSSETSDNFTFNVHSGASVIANANFAISVTPTTAAPKLTVNAGATVAEGSSVALTTAQLNATDQDTTSGNIIYRVTSAPSNGQLELVSNPGVAINKFTQADLAAGKVQYVHNGSETAADSFTFNISDGTHYLGGNQFNIGVTPVNDAPVLNTNAGATVNEGSTAAITTSQLSASDVDTTNANLVYAVTAGPANGQLELAGNPGTAITSFTQADLAAGNVQYVHNGSETTADTFTFSLSDGQATLADAAFNINVTPVNDAPVLTANAGAAVNEGGTTAITTAQLNATDADTANSNLVYTVTAAPANGQLELSTNPGAAITSFTQADLAAGNVQYVHNGSETTSDSFSFNLSDGNTTLTGNTFSLGVTPVNDAPTLTANNSVTVAEGGTTTLTTAQLNATDADTPDSNLTYTVTNAPTNGQLQLSTNPGTSITSFTQADLAAGKVQYVHNGSETTADNFIFSLSDGTTTIPDHVTNIDITPVNDAPTLAANTGTSVNEGGTVSITSANLRASDVDTPDYNLTYTVTSAPANGRLELTTNPGSAITSFTQADLNAGRVQYVHNGSETTADNFTFSLSDGGTTLSGNNFHIGVHPVDDAPTINRNLGVTVAEGATATITTSALRARDVDTSNANLTFSVTAGPANGYLQLSTNAGAAITSFTEADLAAGRVQYVHNGSETTADSFTFRLSDQTTTLAPANFNITVTPVDDAPVLATNTGTSVSLLAGSTILTTSQLSASDVDTAASNITFTVTGGLAHGFLDLTTAPTTHITSFTESDLLAGRVQYTHTGFSLAADSFTFKVKDQTTTLAASTFNINVTL